MAIYNHAFNKTAVVQGELCVNVNCGSTSRYKHSGQCVRCAKARGRKNNASHHTPAYLKGDEPLCSCSTRRSIEDAAEAKKLRQSLEDFG